MVPAARILDGGAVREGDGLLGLASSGLHTNGYTLARRIVFHVLGLGPDDPFPGTGRTVADELLEVHRSYAPLLLPLLEADTEIHALAHVTGGGIPGNLPRVLPDGLGAEVWRDSWEVPAVFRTLQEAGGVPREEMDRVFNMGIGMIVVGPDAALEPVGAAARDAGIQSHRIGRVVAGEGVRYV